MQWEKKKSKLFYMLPIFFLDPSLKSLPLPAVWVAPHLEVSFSSLKND